MNTTNVMSKAGLAVLISILGASRLLGQTVFYVDTDAQGTGDGSSWCDAMTLLQDALVPSKNLVLLARKRLTI